MSDDTSAADAETLAETSIEPSEALRVAAHRLTEDIINTGLPETGEGNGVMLLLEMVLFGVVTCCVKAEFQDAVLNGISEATRKNLATRRAMEGTRTPTLQ